MKKIFIIIAALLMVFGLIASALANTITYHFTGERACPQPSVLDCGAPLPYPDLVDGQISFYGISSLLDVVDGGTYQSSFNVTYTAYDSSVLATDSYYGTGVFSLGYNIPWFGLPLMFSFNLNDSGGPFGDHSSLYIGAEDSFWSSGYWPAYIRSIEQTTTVPEPATLFMLSSGLLGLLWLRKKFKV